MFCIYFYLGLRYEQQSLTKMFLSLYVRSPTKILLVLKHCIQMIKARIATCEFILLPVIEFKYIKHGVILRSIILYLKLGQVRDN